MHVDQRLDGAAGSSLIREQHEELTGELENSHARPTDVVAEIDLVCRQVNDDIVEEENHLGHMNEDNNNSSNPTELPIHPNDDSE